VDRGGGENQGGGGRARGTHGGGEGCSEESCKEKRQENANRPLDITGEMFPDLSRFYLATCL